MQVVCLSPAICRNLLLNIAKKIAKKIIKTLFLGGRGSSSFKVIDVDKPKKPVTSVCYDMQQVYLSATVFTL